VDHKTRVRNAILVRDVDRPPFDLFDAPAIGAGECADRPTFVETSRGSPSGHETLMNEREQWLLGSSVSVTSRAGGAHREEEEKE